MGTGTLSWWHSIPLLRKLNLAFLAEQTLGVAFGYARKEKDLTPAGELALLGWVHGFLHSNAFNT